MSPTAERPASIPVRCGCTLPCTTPQTPGTRFGDGVIPMMQVEVPTTLTMSSVRQPAPMASQCASKAPTGIGMPALRPSFSAQCGERRPGDLVGSRVFAVEFFANAGEQRIDLGQELFAAAGRRVSAFHIHLWPMAQTLRFAFRGSVMPQSVAATMSQCSKAETNFARCVGVVAQPVQQLGKSPLGGIDAAAPLDGFELFAVRGFGDLGGFAFGAVVAPEIVVVERLQILVDGNDRGAGGVESDGFDLVAGDAGLLERLARGGGQGAHVVVMRLRGVFGIFALAMQRIFGNGGVEQAALAVHDGDADAQGAEIHSGDDRHQLASR